MKTPDPLDPRFWNPWAWVLILVVAGVLMYCSGYGPHR